MIRPLELLPGLALGPFELGATLFSVLNLVRSRPGAYPSVKVAWDEESPSTSEIHLILSTPPLSLLFHPLSQRLVRIEVTGEAGAAVAYKGKSLRGAEDDDDDDGEEVVKTVRRVMGPTYSSGPNGAQAEVLLSYPGVVFVVDKGPVGVSQLSRIILTPLPTAEHVSADQAWLHPVLPESPTVAEGDLRLAEIMLDSRRKPTAVHLHFHSNDPSPAPPIVLKILETTNEDLLCDIGSPVRSFWKEDDRMSIHTSRSGVDPSLQSNAYFLSYPHLGLTFLMHPARHRLLKIILHSNLPGEVSFGRTSRCAWALVDSTTKERRAASDPIESIVELLRDGSSPSASSPRPIPGANDLLSVGSSGGSKVGSADSARSGSPSSMGSKAGSKKSRGKLIPVEVSHATDQETERPMVLDRTADGGEGPVKGKQTEIHGYPGIAFEVTGSGGVETVWLF